MTAEAPKAYWIARLDVTDPQAYARYRELNALAFAKHGGRFLVRGGPFDLVRGEARQHNVVLEFPSLAAARACYASAEYQAALLHLSDVGPVDLVIIEGYAGAQPGG